MVQKTEKYDISFLKDTLQPGEVSLLMFCTTQKTFSLGSIQLRFWNILACFKILQKGGGRVFLNTVGILKMICEVDLREEVQLSDHGHLM